MDERWNEDDDVVARRDYFVWRLQGILANFLERIKNPQPPPDRNLFGLSLHPPEEQD